MTDTAHLLSELVNRLDQVDRSRCDHLRDFLGWFDLYKRRNGMDDPDWLQDALAEFEPGVEEEDDEDDEVHYEIQDLDLNGIEEEEEE